MVRAVWSRGATNLDVREHVARLALLRATTAATAAAAAAREQHHVREEVGGLRLQQADLRVGMEPELEWRLGGQLLLDVRGVLVEFARLGALVVGCELVLRVGDEQLGVEEDLEVRIRDPSVERVCDVAAVHDLAKVVADVGPRYVLVALEVVVQHGRAHGEVAVVERVRP